MTKITSTLSVMLLAASHLAAQTPPPNPNQVALLRWYHANVVTQFPLGQQGSGQIVFDGQSIWVAYGSHSGIGLSKLRASDGALLGNFPVDSPVFGTAFDGANIWVVMANGKVSKLRASDGVVLGTYHIGPVLLGVAFDGAHIWVSDTDGFNIAKVRIADGALLQRVSLGPEFSPRTMAFDGQHMWVTLNTAPTNQVAKVRVSDGVVLGTYPVGANVSGVAFDGTNVWVTAVTDGTVTELRASDGAHIATYTNVGPGAASIAFDGANMWVGNILSGTVTKFRVSDGAVVGTYSVPGPAIGLAFDGANMWVSGIINAGMGMVLKM